MLNIHYIGIGTGSSRAPAHIQEEQLTARAPAHIQEEQLTSIAPAHIQEEQLTSRPLAQSGGSAA
jgi:hypothetical protein